MRGKPKKSSLFQNTVFTETTKNVKDGMVCMNGTTSVPKSVLRYVVDKVNLEILEKLVTFMA